MATPRLRSDQVQRLAQDVSQKILTSEALILQSEGSLTIRIFRNGDSFDIKLLVTT